MSFSGYFYAGVAGSGSAVPFGGVDGLGAHSPALLVPQIRPDARTGMYFIVVADPSQAFFGTQATSFEKILKDNGYRYLAVNSKYGHGWDEVQVENPRVLAAWAAQLVRNGVW
jgi:hypothetical protein